MLSYFPLITSKWSLRGQWYCFLGQSGGKKVTLASPFPKADPVKASLSLVSVLSLLLLFVPFAFNRSSFPYNIKKIKNK